MTDLAVCNWRRVLLRLLLKVRSWVVIIPALEVELFEAQRLRRARSGSRKHRDGLTYKVRTKSRKITTSVTANGTGYLLKSRQEKCRELSALGGPHPRRMRSKDFKKLLECARNNPKEQAIPQRYITNGGGDFVSLFTKRGVKPTNQDAMLVLENFTAFDTIFCGVFDGHGPDGHLVARTVRDFLPKKLATSWQALYPTATAAISSSETGSLSIRTPEDAHLVTTWKESFLRAYKLTDRELLVNEKVDSVASGTTAVTFIKQGNHLIIGHVGDSRAVLGMVGDDDSLMALQLTVDLKPNLPREAERIRRLKGRVFALRNEPMVKRVWLPHRNTPGLAMARALGDYCLKNFGVISEPVITYRQLTEKDRFILLATDGVWDVLSNEKAIEIVASVPEKSLAAKAVVDAAVRRWKSSRSASRVDDCSAVCCFFDDSCSGTCYSLHKAEDLLLNVPQDETVTLETTTRKRKVSVESTRMIGDEKEWSGLTRASKQPSFSKDDIAFWIAQ